MIRQCLSNKYESVAVAKIQNFCKLNKALPFAEQRSAKHPHPYNLLVRPVSVEVSPGCHAHLLERHVSKTTLFCMKRR